jgi:hypothetical protein
VSVAGDVQTLRDAAERGLSFLRSLALARFVQGPREDAPYLNVRWTPDEEQIAESIAALDRLVGELQRLQDADDNYAGYGEILNAAEARVQVTEHALRGSEARRQAAVLALREAKVAIVATCDEGFDSTRREQALKGMAAIDAALAAAATPPDTPPEGDVLWVVGQSGSAASEAGDGSDIPALPPASATAAEQPLTAPGSPGGAPSGETAG